MANAQPRSNTLPEFDNFVELVHSLPPELFNNSRDMVFYEEPSDKRITKYTRPPPQLGVNRAIRATFAMTYYGSGSTFRFKPDLKRTLCKWLIFLAPEHRALIGWHCLLYYMVDKNVPVHDSRQRLLKVAEDHYERDIETFVLPKLEEGGVLLDDGVLLTKCIGSSLKGLTCGWTVNRIDFVFARKGREYDEGLMVEEELSLEDREEEESLEIYREHEESSDVGGEEEDSSKEEGDASS